jgi:hypothetical protein
MDSDLSKYEIRAARRDMFGRLYTRLISRYGSESAYRMCEKYEKHKHGERLYKSYHSFRRSNNHFLHKKMNKPKPVHR